MTSPPAPRRRQWSLRRWITATVLVTAIVAVLAIISGTAALVQLSDARNRVIQQLDPASRAADGLLNALINEETGVRGYALSGKDDFLQPYTDGQQDEHASTAALRRTLGSRFPQASADLDAVLAAADRWRSEYALPTIAQVRAGQLAAAAGNIQQGKDLFDGIRTAASRQSADLDALRRQGLADLHTAIDNLIWVSATLGVALVVGVTALALGLQRGVKRPVTTLSTEVRTVAAGDYDHAVRATGPTELVNLGADVDTMRVRILAELSTSRQAQEALDLQARDLQRSNTELEQFAYVASHDLQEPLRKVTSFCQLLENRYHDQLDDRGRQYIDFAVDGAARMQTLINDLLAFSRVGRLNSEFSAIDLNTVAANAIGNLSRSIEESGAIVTADRLPTVTGDASLLTVVVQNLLNNGIKFRSPDVTPEVRLTVEDSGDTWLFTCADNGIGIEPEYVERIFVIFQRLHPKDRYPGTGIGLAMCRKIIEYHGGQIWLDAEHSGSGATFRFTLPRGDERRGVT
ncbi:MAG TPA: ATP-binding protein [Micromonosporaceae bacterium]